MITSLIFIAWYGKVKYTWSKKHQKEARKQALHCRFPFLKRASSSSLTWRRPSLSCLWQAVEGASSSPGAPGAHFPRWSRGPAAWPSARGEGRLSAWHLDQVDTLSVWQRVRNRQLSKQANYKTCLQCPVQSYLVLSNKNLFFFFFFFLICKNTFLHFIQDHHTLWSKPFPPEFWNNYFNLTDQCEIYPLCRSGRQCK